MDREAWRATVRGVAESRTWLSNWTELNRPETSILVFKEWWTVWFLRKRNEVPPLCRGFGTSPHSLRRSFCRLDFHSTWNLCLYWLDTELQAQKSTWAGYTRRNTLSGPKALTESQDRHTAGYQKRAVASSWVGGCLSGFSLAVPSFFLNRLHGLATCPLVGRRQLPTPLKRSWFSTWRKPTLSTFLSVFLPSSLQPCPPLSPHPHSECHGEKYDWPRLHQHWPCGTICCLLVGRGMQWHPTPVLLPGNSHGRRSLVGCSPWGR